MVVRMILNALRIIFGFRWEWHLEKEVRFSNGVELFYICQRTGRMKKVWVGSYD